MFEFAGGVCGFNDIANYAGHVRVRHDVQWDEEDGHPLASLTRVLQAGGGVDGVLCLGSDHQLVFVEAVADVADVGNDGHRFGLAIPKDGFGIPHRGRFWAFESGGGEEDVADAVHLRPSGVGFVEGDLLAEHLGQEGVDFLFIAIADIGNERREGARGQIRIGGIAGIEAENLSLIVQGEDVFGCQQLRRSSAVAVELLDAGTALNFPFPSDRLLRCVHKHRDEFWFEIQPRVVLASLPAGMGRILLKRKSGCSNEIEVPCFRPPCSSKAILGLFAPENAGIVETENVAVRCGIGTTVGRTAATGDRD